MKLVIETLTCKKYYLVNKDRSPEKEVEELTDNICELHSIKEESDSKYESRDLTEKETEDEVFKRAMKSFVVHDSIPVKKKRKPGRPKGNKNAKK